MNRHHEIDGQSADGDMDSSGASMAVPTELNQPISKGTMFSSAYKMVFKRKQAASQDSQVMERESDQPNPDHGKGGEHDDDDNNEEEECSEEEEEPQQDVKEGTPGSEDTVTLQLFVITTSTVTTLLFAVFPAASQYVAWFLLVFCVLGFLYMKTPRFLAWVLSESVTRFALFGYPFSVGSLSLGPRIYKGRLHVRLVAEDIGFANPPGFPHQWFVFCGRLDLEMSIPLKKIPGILMLQMKRIPLKRVPDFDCLVVIDVPYIDFDNVKLNFELMEGKFNINEVTKEIAQREVIAYIRGVIRKQELVDRLRSLLPEHVADSIPFLTPAYRSWNWDAYRTVDVEPVLPEQGNVVEEEAEPQVNGEEHEEVPVNETGTTGLLKASKSVRVNHLGGKLIKNVSKAIPLNFSNTKKKIEENLTEEQARTRSLNELVECVLPNKLEVTIIRARNLEAGDRNIFTGSRSTDPVVTIKVRDKQKVSSTRYNTVKPMWKEKFVFPVTDASTVLHISVSDEDLTSKDFLGQWIMTLKYLVVDPSYCWHNPDSFEVDHEAHSIKGWFPLMDKKWKRRGECGEIEMLIRWYHDPEFDTGRAEAARTAMSSLDQNSKETNLRLGSRERVTDMLNHVPVLFNMHRVTIRKVSFFLQDLFRGNVGHAELLHKRGKSSDKASKIKIPVLEWKTAFRPSKGEPGITTYKVLYSFFIKGLLPKIFKHNILAGALSATATGFAANMAQTTERFFKGEMDFTGLKKVGKKIGGEFRIAGRHVKKKLKADNKVEEARVDAEDEEYLYDCIIEGYLRKCSFLKARRKLNMTVSNKSFKRCRFELKGKSMFYKPMERSEPRKIPLNTIQLVQLDLDRQEISLFRQYKVTILRVCMEEINQYLHQPLPMVDLDRSPPRARPNESQLPIGSPKSVTEYETKSTRGDEAHDFSPTVQVERKSLRSDTESISSSRSTGMLSNWKNRLFTKRESSGGGDTSSVSSIGEHDTEAQSLEFETMRLAEKKSAAQREEINLKLMEWFQALKDCGVNTTIVQPSGI